MMINELFCQGNSGDAYLPGEKIDYRYYTQKEGTEEPGIVLTAKGEKVRIILFGGENGYRLSTVKRHHIRHRTIRCWYEKAIEGLFYYVRQYPEPPMAHRKARTTAPER